MVPTLAVAAKILSEEDIPADVRRQGVLTVERRWVANDLPEWEILDALAHAHGLLTLIVQSAHRKAGRAVMDTPQSSIHLPNVIPPQSKLDRLPCMVAPESLRSVRVHLGENKIVQVGFNPVEPQSLKEELVERYGPFSLPPPPGSIDPFEWAPTYMEHAKRVLSIDKYHSQMAFLFGPDGRFASFTSMPEDQQDKYLFLNELATAVKRTGATGIVFIADTWIVPATVDMPPGKRPADMEEREEALGVTAARSDGSVMSLMTPYARGPDDTIEFGETVEVGVEGGEVFLLPVMQAWGVKGFSEQGALEKLKKELSRLEPPEEA
jgi:hypothetical protein